MQQNFTDKTTIGNSAMAPLPTILMFPANYKRIRANFILRFLNLFLFED